MTFQELLREEHVEGRLEERRQVIIEFLEELGEIPKNLQEEIKQTNDLNVLKAWSKIAAKAESIVQFEREMKY